VHLSTARLPHRDLIFTDLNNAAMAAPNIVDTADIGLRVAALIVFPGPAPTWVV
jgi:hypothetical protein